MEVRTFLLGEFRVIVNGRPVDTTSGRRSRNLIAYLLAQRSTAVPAEVLTKTFWPNARPAAARNSLHVALSKARRMLGEPIIVRRLDAYGISPEAKVWADADEFERECRAKRYEAAIALYGGAFLADEPHAVWAQPRREALRALAVEAQSQLVARCTAQGDHEQAAVMAARILAEDPRNEDVHRGLMLCYASAGRRHLALLQYRKLAATLWDDLRVRPEPETTALFEQLRRAA